MTRRRIRENLYIMLFQTNFYKNDDLLEQADIYLEELKAADATAEVKTELKERFCAVLSHMEEIDRIIEEKSKGWTFSRLAKADLTVMRLAVFEILFDEKVPCGVAINEAVELARKYGGDKSSGFVNGVLASVARDTDMQQEEKS